MARILFMANAPWCATGYGVQGKHLVPRLQALGHYVAYFAFYGLAGGVLNVGNTKVLPMANAPWGEDILAAHMEAEKADVLVTLMDVWVTDFFGRKAREHGWAWLPWTPIDQSPVPRRVLERLDGARLVLAYSHFGVNELEKAGVYNVRYVPHAVDIDVFKPMDKAEARKTFRIPEEAFVIGMVAANKGFPSRKCFPEQLLAFREFKKTHQKAVLYLHTLMTGAQGGVDLHALVRDLGLREGVDVLYTNQYRYSLGLDEQVMAQLYNSFDILSGASMSEGFGIPLLEAQACGVPVVTNDTTSMPELTFAGKVVSKNYPYWTPLDAWVAIPDYHTIADAYGELAARYQDDIDRDAEVARGFAEQYAWPEVVEKYWRPLLEEVDHGLERDRQGTVQLVNR